MRFVFVLEDDPKLQREIFEAIHSIDPLIQIRLFPALQLFADWIKELMEKGPSVIVTAGVNPPQLKQEIVETQEGEIHQLATVISKIEFLGSKPLQLIKKTQDLIIDKGMCPKDNPTSFIITTFEDPLFKIKNYEDPVVNNVLFKPFDKLILAQDLSFAIEGRKAPKHYAITNQKTTAHIEMLKNVKLVGMSDVGFVTESDRIIQAGVSSKYYGLAFATDKQISVIGTLAGNKPHPTNKDLYLCTFNFFGLNANQLTAIRKKVRVKGSAFEFLWNEQHINPFRLNRQIGVVIVEEDLGSATDFAETLIRKFEPLKVVHYKNLYDFLIDLDPEFAESEQAPSTTKGLPEKVDIKFIFDQFGSQLLDVQHNSKDPILTFGMKENEIRANPGFWEGALGKEQIVIWRDWLLNPRAQVFIVRNGNNRFYIKPVTLNRDPETKKVTIKIQELTPEERYVFLSSSSKLPKVTDLMIVSHRFLHKDNFEKWDQIRELLRRKAGNKDYNPVVLQTAIKEYTEKELIKLTPYVSDIIYKPVDRKNFMDKVHMFVPELKVLKEPIIYNSIKVEENIKAATSVEITEISEAALTMNYNRALSIGEFREFVLWLPYDLKAARLVGACNYITEGAQKGTYKLNFIFFGVTDGLLKAIRIWIRDYYITRKDMS